MIPLLIILLKLRVELISTVLFDLDGTFVDTAFDIIETANIVYKNNYKSEIRPDRKSLNSSSEKIICSTLFSCLANCAVSK